MVTQQLIDYILQARRAGYDINTVRSYLIQNGWDPQTVDAAISQATSPQQSHTTIHVSNTTLMGIGAVILVVGFSFILANYLFSEDENDTKYLLDYTISLVTEEITPGESLLFTNSIANMGNIQRYDVFLDYQVISESDGRLIARWNETKEVSGLNSYAVKKRLEAPPGRYKVHGVITYAGDMKAESSAQFTVEESATGPSCSDGIRNQGEEEADCGGPCEPCPTCDDGVKNQDEEDIDCGGPCEPCITDDCGDCNDLDPCTEDLCIDSVCTYKPVTPCCGNSICEGDENNTCRRDCGGEEPSAQEIMKEAEEIAEENHVKAAEYCEDIEDVKKRDVCFQTVAVTSEKADVCDLINTSSTRDLCYMKHIREKQDYSYCEKLNNKNLREACISMREIKED